MYMPKRTIQPTSFSFLWFIIFIVFIFIFTIFIYSLTKVPEEIFTIDENISPSKHLKTHGFAIYKNVLPDGEIDALKDHCSGKNYKEMKEHILKHPRLRELIDDATESKEYDFQDYVWIIEKSSVHTCHRDNNGDFFNEGQKYPSYTIICYLEDMDKCLLIIPKSHENFYSHFINFNNNYTKNVLCRKGDIVIFNANLIHAGTLTKKENNKRIQLKVTHREDVAHIKYYENYNKVLNQENKIPVYLRQIQQNITCALPGLSNLTQKENIRTARGSQEGVQIGLPQRIFSYLFYGNKDFYDLPNAF